MMRATKSQAGVMLIEALVGILIFSIGILALIGMQGAAMRNTNDAKYRSEAAFLVNEIIGRMWVEDLTVPANLQAYDTDSGAHAVRDAWEQRVERALPGVDVANNVNRPRIDYVLVGASNELTVTVLWQQPGESTVRRVSMVNRINGGT
jgi:type IV pilus assembly protein PilV